MDSKSFLDRRELRGHQFSLLLDWPRAAEGLTVRRSVGTPSDIMLQPDISSTGALFDAPLDTSTRVGLAEWQRLIERDLFRLPAEHSGISGRALLSLYMRRVGSNAFNEAVKTASQQSPAEASANVAYLLGLDWQLAARYKELSVRESTRRRLAQAAKDPVWGRIVGRSSELRGQITIAQQRVNDLERQIQSFRVVPEYENLQRQADEMDRRIRQMRAQDIVDRRNLQDYEAALEDSVAPDISYLESVYSELGVVLGQAVRRRYGEVEDFHHAVVRNRRAHLEGEVESLREGLARRENERVSLGEEQARILRALNEGGALDALTALQQALAQERASLEALRHRYEAAQALEASSAEIKAERGKLEAETRMDLHERERAINDVNVRFLEYASRLYGSGREAYLDIDPTSTHLKIVPHIDSKDSRGIGNMVIFCFDLTVAVTARKGARGPDFLVHDSHLFDGVDERQLARALSLTREVVEAESMQYVVTMNSDDLEKVSRQGLDLSAHIIDPRLTDSLEDGGLFGFRFS
ncbi:ABC-three component system protein [Kutzneria sp. 744]|uniref:ABC-three component system protein n=1 Tax=Kutzneria sp. (strain 744) TaxID=345341 RepID=UPI0018DB9021|nr:ABC-three component system protein [Kutzneria sp. 744]